MTISVLNIPKVVKETRLRKGTCIKQKLKLVHNLIFDNNLKYRKVQENLLSVILKN